MSRAFVKEDTPKDDDADALPERPATPLPITLRGRDELAAELDALVRAGDAGTRRARQLQQVLSTVVVRAPALQGGGAGFGCTVTCVLDDGSTRDFEIVGPDEARPDVGRVSVASPIGRALLGKQPGDVAVWRRPAGDVELEIVRVRVPRDPARAPDVRSSR